MGGVIMRPTHHIVCPPSVSCGFIIQMMVMMVMVEQNDDHSPPSVSASKVALNDEDAESLNHETIVK